jgi:hypothetical protein
MLTGIEVESTPELHPAILAFGEERPDSEGAGNLVGHDYSTQRRRHDRVDAGDAPIRGGQSGQLRTERGGNRRMLQHQGALQIT